MWLSWEGMDGISLSHTHMRTHTHTHTHTQTNTRRVPLRHATTIWLDSPCCCLDLPYFNRWWLHTENSMLSWPCNAGISKGIFWGPFADWLSLCLCPMWVSRKIHLFALHPQQTPFSFDYLDLIMRGRQWSCDSGFSCTVHSKWLPTQFIFHPSKTMGMSSVEMM